jgi:hypothetical protein
MPKDCTGYRKCEIAVKVTLAEIRSLIKFFEEMKSRTYKWEACDFLPTTLTVNMSSLRSLFTSKSKGTVLRNLRDQTMTIASIDAKIHAAFLAVAMLDALGNPLQGEPRVENRIIDEMRPHASAPP